MGGRLAMHALLQHPQNWAGAVLISAHPGLATPQEREVRGVTDQKWAARWLNDKWSDVWSAWQAQPVFKTTQPSAVVIERTEREFDRDLLAQGMIAWSVSEQENLLEPLLKFKKPVLWLAGDEDTKYRVQQYALRIAFLPVTYLLPRAMSSRDVNLPY